MLDSWTGDARRLLVLLAVTYKCDSATVCLSMEWTNRFYGQSTEQSIHTRQTIHVPLQWIFKFVSGPHRVVIRPGQSSNRQEILELMDAIPTN